MQESPVNSHSLAQVLWLLLASSLGWTGAELRSWLARRKREPVELDKVRAETRSIHTSSDIAPLGITLETFRELQAVIQKAETRREEWHLKEEQMRGQILFWRSKAEELDGDLIDLREEIDHLKSQLKLNDYQLKRQMHFIEMKNLKDDYIALDTPRE